MQEVIGLSPIGSHEESMQQKCIHPASPSRSLKLVAIHLGIRNSSHDAESMVLAQRICERVMADPTIIMSEYSLDKDKEALPKGSAKDSLSPQHGTSHAELAVVELVKLMENNPRLNCGYGSNLNIRGEVECDASIMCDLTQVWAGVGSVSGCRNPILLAKCIYDRLVIPRPLNLIQPNLLVGTGARLWMREHCPNISVVDSKLISSKSLSKYQKYKSNYDACLRVREQSEPNKSNNYGSDTLLDQSLNAASSTCDTDDIRLDTVGAIAIDCDDNFASAVSSGGLMLKYKGRVGHAAIPGAGCWAQRSIAVSTTGLGECLTQCMLAKSCHSEIEKKLSISSEQPEDLDMSEPISEAIRLALDELTKSASLSHIPEDQKLAGLVSVCALNSKGPYYLSYGMNAPSICIGYMSRDDTKGHSISCHQKAGQIQVRTVKICVN